MMKLKQEPHLKFRFPTPEDSPPSLPPLALDLDITSTTYT